MAKPQEQTVVAGSSGSLDRPQRCAATMAQRRIGALTTGTCFSMDQEWRLEFEHLKRLVTAEHREEFQQTKKSDHGVIYEDISAEAGFLLGVEIGKRLAGGAR